MTKGSVKLFKDKYLLSDMLALRSQGWALTSLAFLFDCDWTSIEAQCKRYNAHPNNEIYTIERITSTILKLTPEDKWKIRDGERLNRGKNYIEYLKAYPHRKLR